MQQVFRISDFPIEVDQLAYSIHISQRIVISILIRIHGSRVVQIPGEGINRSEASSGSRKVACSQVEQSTGILLLTGKAKWGFITAAAGEFLPE
jgi:hypothetical protein